jgi:hypothetical protein
MKLNFGDVSIWVRERERVKLNILIGSLCVVAKLTTRLPQVAELSEQESISKFPFMFHFHKIPYRIVK